MLLRLKMIDWFLKVLTYFLSVAAYYAGWWVWTFISKAIGRPEAYSARGHLDQVLFAMFVWAFMSEAYRVTSSDELFRERTGGKAAASACVATSFVLLVALYFSRNELFPRGLLVCDIATVFVLSILLHAAFRIICRRHASFWSPTKLLVIGANRFARDIAARMQRLSFAPCEIVGYVRLPEQEGIIAGDNIYDFDELETMDCGQAIDEIVLAIQPAQFFRIPAILKALEPLCRPARAVVDLGEAVVVRERLFQIGNMQMLDLMTTPTESLDYALFKRAFDVIFSSLVLLIVSPLFCAIAALIKLGSPGPVFFVQERVGLNGKPFQMFKFRTMRIGDRSESDTRWTTSDDARRTPFGIFLRKTSLDELPQFINVLRGDMSVVGPRPERPHFVHKFLQEVARYNTRHVLKVGITGWAQVNGWRGNTSIEKRIQYDLYYLQNWSLGFDLRIILMTVVMGLVNRNAY